MSVVVVLRIKADPNALEKFANAHADLMNGIADAGRAAGAVRHSFAATEDEVLVIDEWPDEEAFRKFFDSQPDIAQVMHAAGAQGPPAISFYRKLDTPDQF